MRARTRLSKRAGRVTGLCAALALCAQSFALPLAAQTAPAQTSPAPATPAPASGATPAGPVTPAPAPAASPDAAKAATTPAPAASSPASPAPASPPAAPASPAPASPAQTAPAPASPGQQSAAPQAEGETPLVALAPRPAAVLRGTSNWGQGYPTILSAFARLAKALEANGLKPAGKPLAVLIETRDDGFTFEAMAPLDAAPAGKTELDAEVKIGQTPAGKAYKFQHRSAYDDLDSTYEAITAFLDEKNMQAKEVIIEEYLTTPKDADDTTLEVDIYVFLKDD